MASGGATKKGVSSNGSYKPIQNSQDQQWMVLPNNLDLRSNSQSANKQRNKAEYPTESSPQYNIMPSSNANHHVPSTLPSNKLSSASRQKGQQFLADGETSYQNVFRQHGEQHSHYQDQHSADMKRRKAPENSGRKSFKENNTQKVPDTNAIVERLGHLRDYMKDVSSVMENLEKSDDPATRDQRKKLNHMLRQLQQEEQQYFDLLQQMLTTDEQQLEMTSDTNAVISPIESNDRENNEEVEERIERGQKLLKRMIESEEKMQSLKKQEADLLAMQKEAEYKLAEAKAFHSTLMKREQAVRNENERYTFPAEWNYITQDNTSYCGGDGMSNDNQAREKCPVGVSTNLERVGEGDHSHTIQTKNEELASTGFEAAFESLKHRLQHLKDMNNTNPSEQQCEQAPVEPAESADSKMEWHRKKLENKLKELQEKKKHMDTMLIELSALEQASADIKNGHTNSNQLQTADTSIEEAQHLLDAIDAREKMKKLEEMKESLKQLRSLVNSIQPTTNIDLSQSNEEHIETISNSSRSSSQIAQHRSDTPRSQQYQQTNSQPKKDNIRRDKSNKFPVRRHYEAEGRANEDGDNTVPSSSARTSISNVDDSWETDPQIQEKVRKLKDAKEKLQRLQELMSAVENSKGSDYPSTLEYLQLLNAISDEDKQEEDGQQESQLNSNETKNCHEEEAAGPHTQEMMRLDAVEERMQEQEKELEKLMEDRLHLLSVQNQLTKIQQQFKNSHGTERLRLQQKSLNQSCSNSNSSSSRGHSPCHQVRAENCLSSRQNLPYDSTSHINPNMKSHAEGRIAVTKKDNINSMSANLSGRVKRGKDDHIGEGSSPNATIDSLLSQGNDLDHTITLRELKQNALLETILGQSQSKRGYSHNEDVHSHSCSSANSEFQEGSNSILAPDTTVAATWGGSSTQNDLEDERVESLDEQEGSEVEVPHQENIWQPQNRMSPVQQSFRRELTQGEQDVELQIRRNNRLGSHNFKADHVNRWNDRKNFHHKQQTNHLPSTSNQDMHGNLHASNRLNTEELGQPQNLVTPDGTCNTTVWQQFTHHIHQQLEHMNTLCQSIFHDQQALTSCFLSSSLSSPLVGRSSRSVVSDSWFQNTYQYQQQQQSLLNLSQCYHMIHLQQLEIQYLHQCLQQHPDAEHAVVQTTPIVNQEHVPEEFTFRPWLTAPSSNTQGSLSTAQSSTVPPQAFVQSNADSNVTPNVSNAPSNSFSIPAQTSSCNFVEQNVVSATLNNQVPPRTRANNFWDNFRSYSCQNMLSTSKSNEALSTNVSAAHQLQSPPVDNIASASSWSRQPSVRSQPCIENAAHTNCLKGRRLPNTKLQEIMIKSKKPNASKDRRQTGYMNKTVSTQQSVLKPKLSSGKDFQLRETPPAFRTCPLQNAPASSESSHFFFQPSSDNRTGETEQRNLGNVGAMQESVFSEVKKIISQAEGKPDLLLAFLKKLKHLSIDSQESSAVLNSSGAPEHQTIIEEFHLKNKSTSNASRDMPDIYNDCRTVTSLQSQFSLKDMQQEDKSSYSICQSRNDSSQGTSIGSSTGAVRKRTSSKRSKAEHSAVPLINSAGIAQCIESSKEKVSRAEKQEIHIVTEEELDIMPEQEERGAVGLDLISGAGNRSVQIAEEDMGYECDPEGETEPDVEAETDDTKDLAEADQSPGQRDHTQHFRQAESLTTVGSAGALFSNSTTRSETSGVTTSPDILMANSDEQSDVAAASSATCDNVHTQPAADDLPTVDELTLDDIPTKLTALSEEEVQKQMAEEVVAASLLHDVLSEELSDAAKEQGSF